jgi:ribonuclease P protein component
MNHFYLRLTKADTVKVIISVSKKVSKKAVIRNRIKRRVRAAMQKFHQTLKPAQYLIIAKIGAENVKGEELKKELLRLIRYNI